LKWEAGYLLIGGGFALWLLMKIKLIPAGFLGFTVFDGVDWLPWIVSAVGCGMVAQGKRLEQKAEEEYWRHKNRDPKDADAYNNRGLAWSNKGDTDRAIADFNRAIELDPKYVYAYNGRGLAWYNKGDTDRAIADYNRAIELDPKNAYAYYNRGLAHEDREGGDLASALTDFRTFVRLSPNDPDGPRAVSRVEAKIDARNKR